MLASSLIPMISNWSLSHEQEDLLRRCLHKEEVALTPGCRDELFRRIEADVNRFLKKNEERLDFRQLHDALRQIWLLAHDDDCGVGQLRARIRSLPPLALGYIKLRVERVMNHLFEDTSDEDLLTWVADAPPEKLVEFASVASATGSRIVPGRSRGAGSRSRARLEPLIRGTVRGGGNENGNRGGRPSQSAQDHLVAHLALSWTSCTRCMPRKGRSDRTGFGDLVHCVFDWLDERGAQQALRRFWSRGKQQELKLDPDC